MSQAGTMPWICHVCNWQSPLTSKSSHLYLKRNKRGMVKWTSASDNQLSHLGAQEILSSVGPWSREAPRIQQDGLQRGPFIYSSPSFHGFWMHEDTLQIQVAMLSTVTLLEWLRRHVRQHAEPRHKLQIITVPESREMKLERRETAGWLNVRLSLLLYLLFFERKSFLFWPLESHAQLPQTMKRINVCQSKYYLSA